MNKPILTLVIMSFLMSCKAQNTFRVVDKFETPIQIKDVCFNGVCLHDSVTYALKVLGKPNENLLEKLTEPVDGRIYLFKHYRYFDGESQKKYFQFTENTLSKEGIIIDFMYAGHSDFRFGRKKQFYIGQDTTELKKIIPLLYIQERQLNDFYIRQRLKSIKKSFEEVKQSKKFKTDATFREAKINEFNERKRIIESDKCCLEISIDIENNKFGYYSIILRYGKTLSSMRFYREY